MSIRRAGLFVLSMQLIGSTLNGVVEQTYDWTWLIYMEASEGLLDMAVKSLNDMAAIDAGNNAQVFVLLHAYNQEAWLYRITYKSIEQLHKVRLSHEIDTTLVEVMSTVVDVAPADQYGLILWGHGAGILMPEYDDQTGMWLTESDRFAGIIESLADGCNNGACSLSQGLETENHTSHKGVLKNGYTKTCMDNHQLVELCKQIYTKLGKKLDILGFDLCLASMLEHGYQIREYVAYMIGSQNCELADGWDYDAFMRMVGMASDMNALHVAQCIVKDFQDYYMVHAPVGMYTQSAIDCSYMAGLKENLDAIVSCIRQCPDALKPDFYQLIQIARADTVRFCTMPVYADIYMVYKNISVRLGQLDKRYSGVVNKLAPLLTSGMQLLRDAVIANTAGSHVSSAQGLSIYFPFDHIDRSYAQTIFARESSWLKFLQEICVSGTR